MCLVLLWCGFILFFVFIYLFIFYFWLCWVFISVRGLSLVAASGGHSSSRCAGLSLSRPLPLRSTGSRRAGSVVVAHGLSCSAACGIFPDQGSNPCPLHWQADSQHCATREALHYIFEGKLIKVGEEASVSFCHFYTCKHQPPRKDKGSCKTLLLPFSFFPVTSLLLLL